MKRRTCLKTIFAAGAVSAIAGAADAAHAIAHKELSPVELMKAVLGRVVKLQPILNCFITLVPEQAMAAARQAEDDVMQGKPLGLLHGVPYAAKDLVNTAGVRTGCHAARDISTITVAIAPGPASIGIASGKTATLPPTAAARVSS